MVWPLDVFGKIEDHHGVNLMNWSVLRKHAATHKDGSDNENIHLLFKHSLVVDLVTKQAMQLPCKNLFRPMPDFVRMPEKSL
jgi:hypothetical protein